jgi:hypothetical protein
MMNLKRGEEKFKKFFTKFVAFPGRCVLRAKFNINSEIQKESALR